MDARGHVAVGITIFHSQQKCLFVCLNLSYYNHANSDDLVMRGIDGGRMS